ncbi:uncharacterized protein TRIADDRAFT_53847 [Trichoplax adhaerens]|uniref:Transmembrane protein n=1 Tax=Trichoplax adhaerens TaxID=10228 RepID=B3RQB7_TRIAD|nr:predicted protein [Trichoplax adhaerens]EDV27800.1 predicted protein [Trichoplax adhaerens]|eukprot:XP_002109634.1 predicted protein [Trichoplax adhaerens]
MPNFFLVAGATQLSVALLNVIIPAVAWLTTGIISATTVPATYFLGPGVVGITLATSAFSCFMARNKALDTVVAGIYVFSLLATTYSISSILMFISVIVRLATSNLLNTAVGALIFTLVTIAILCASMGVAIWVIYTARKMLLKSDSVQSVDNPDSPPTVAEPTNCLTDRTLAILEMSAGNLLVITPGVAIFFPSIQRLYCVLPLYAGSLLIASGMMGYDYTTKKRYALMLWSFVMTRLSLLLTTVAIAGTGFYLGITVGSGSTAPTNLALISLILLVSIYGFIISIVSLVVTRKRLGIVCSCNFNVKDMEFIFGVTMVVLGVVYAIVAAVGLVLFAARYFTIVGFFVACVEISFVVRSVLSASFSVECAVLTIVEFIAYLRLNPSSGLLVRGVAMMATILVFNIATFGVAVAATVKTGRKHQLCGISSQTGPSEAES